MDFDTLVTEQINAGKAFLDQLEETLPVQVAYWLKEDDDTSWYLHVSSDQITDQTRREGYKLVGDAAHAIVDPNFDQFRVKLVGVDDTIAQAALDLYRSHTVPIPYRTGPTSFGGRGVEGIYIYPPSELSTAELRRTPLSPSTPEKKS